MRNTGGWEDYTGSGGAVAPLKFLGITNKIQGTRGHLQWHGRIPPITKKGNNAQIYRERQHLNYISLDEE